MVHYGSARAFAVNPARPKARPLRALGVDCSARPSQFAIMPRMHTKLLAGQASGLGYDQAIKLLYRRHG